jgi:hypothetical protein
MSAVLPRCRRATIPMLAVVAALGLAACAEGATTMTTYVARAEPVVTTRPPVAGHVTVESREDLVDERRTSPADVVVDAADPSVLRVRFLAGPPACSGARVAVDEGPAMVRVVLFTGTRPDAAVSDCPAQEVPSEIEIRLDRPLGTRELLGL